MHALTCDDLWRELRTFSETALRRELEDIQKKIKQDIKDELASLAEKHHLAPPVAERHHAAHGSHHHHFNNAGEHRERDYAPPHSRAPALAASESKLSEISTANDIAPHEWMTRHMRGYVAQAEVAEAEAEMIEHSAALPPRVSRRSLAKKGHHHQPLHRQKTVHHDESSHIQSHQQHGEDTTGLLTAKDNVPSDATAEQNMRLSKSSFASGIGPDAWKQASHPEIVKEESDPPPTGLTTAPASDPLPGTVQINAPQNIRDSTQTTDTMDIVASSQQPSSAYHSFRPSLQTEEDDDVKHFGSIWSHWGGDGSTTTGSPERKWADFGGNKWRSNVVALVRHQVFDIITGILIIANAMTIGFQVDHMVRNTALNPPLEYRLVEYFFCVCFSTELGLRVFAYRTNIFRVPGWKWNLFDAFVVFVQILEVFVTIITTTDQTDQDTSAVKFDFSIMRILRVLRLIRIVRLVRVLRIISELRTMVYSIFGTLKPFCWTIMLLGLLIYIVGVQLTQIVADYKVTVKEKGETINDPRMEEHFGSLPRALFSLYQSLSGGVDWGEVCDPLIDQINVGLGLVFGIFIAFAIFALLNVVTGIFVQSAMLAANEDKDVYLVNHVRELFERTDSDGSGKISWEEFEDQLDTKAMREYFKHIDIDVTEARGLFFLLDMDGSGTIDADEFLNGSLRLRGNAKALEMALMLRELKYIADQTKNQKKMIHAVYSEVWRQSGRTDEQPISMPKKGSMLRGIAPTVDSRPNTPVTPDILQIKDGAAPTEKKENNRVSAPP